MTAILLLVLVEIENTMLQLLKNLMEKKKRLSKSKEKKKV